MSLLAIVAAQADAGRFSFTSVATAVVMVAIAVALSLSQRADLERDLLIASLRAFAQFLAIDYVIDVIFATESTTWVIVMIAAMVAFATFTSGQRLRGLPGNYLVATVAIGASSLLTLVLMPALGIISTAARYLIPTGGLAVGNSMNVTSLTGVRLLKDASSQRPLIEAALALGGLPRQAVHAVLRRSVRLAMIPIIDQTKTMGIVFLPGAMTGMIIAGAAPLEAVRFQVVIMYMLLAAVAVTTTATGLLVARRPFTPHQQLPRIER